jgi:hypothetical protein
MSFIWPESSSLRNNSSLSRPTAFCSASNEERPVTRGGNVRLTICKKTRGGAVTVGASASLVRGAVAFFWGLSRAAASGSTGAIGWAGRGSGISGLPLDEKTIHRKARHNITPTTRRIECLRIGHSQVKSRSAAKRTIARDIVVTPRRIPRNAGDAGEGASFGRPGHPHPTGQRQRRDAWLRSTERSCVPTVPQRGTIGKPLGQGE